jgi:hypothetical protein
MRTTLIVAFCLCALAGAVRAQTAPAPSSPAPEPAPAPTIKKGKVKPADAAEKPPPRTQGKAGQDWHAMCLKLWDRETHMTKREWDRACRRSAERQKEILIE